MTTPRTFNTASTPFSACVRSCAGNQASWMRAGQFVSAAFEMRSKSAAIGGARLALAGSELQKVGLSAAGGGSARGLAHSKSNAKRWRYDSLGVLH
jgi:hypothetical protein